ncbi:MAG: SGNH/GDSL hydrolase family protein [Oscillospiraceae bacterium]|nr:SGNH/GDSL hydrolase family protein [Oscillospiraceae bacterium]
MVGLRDGEVILFQGDSITHGGRSLDTDPNHVMGHGYQCVASGRLCAENLDKRITTYNRGISGNRIADLYGRWAEDTLALKPTILSILIGVNDAFFSWRSGTGSDPARFGKIYRLLLDEARAAGPETVFVLMEPFTGPCFADAGAREFMSRRVAELAAVTRRVAADCGAVFVPLQKMLDRAAGVAGPERILWDGIHPTVIGHELIARRWMAVVGRELAKIRG